MGCLIQQLSLKCEHFELFAGP